MLQEMTQKILILLNFPNDSEDKVKEFADNVITIGALNFEYGDKVVARFFKHQETECRCFAPGVKFMQPLQTTNTNTYKYFNGCA
jgi:hypothetical protein